MNSVGDAEQRLAELRAVARTLWPDRDDPVVMSELVAVIDQIRCAEDAIKQLEQQRRRDDVAVAIRSGVES